jgi:C-terminal processing protease CtpA/Prc
MTSRRSLIDTVSTLVLDNYVFPEIAERVVEVLRGNDYEHLADDAGFAAAVTADLQSVNGDKHLRLLTERDLPQGDVTRHCFDKVEVLDDGTGYLAVSLLREPREFGDIAAAAMTLLADTPALIVDLRGCRGGDPGMVALLCAYLFDDGTHLVDVQPRHGELVQFRTPPYAPGRRFGGRKPIWVLTGPVTFSAGEELAYDLQQLGRATIVGEATRGGAHPTNYHRITDGLVVTVPDARAISPVTGGNWEGTGVRPDVPVPAADALTRARELVQERQTA